MKRFLVIALLVPLAVHAESKNKYVRAAPGIYIEARIAANARHLPRVTEDDTRPVLAEKRISPMPERPTAVVEAPQPQRSMQGWLTSSQ